jgi:hypothetical protein
MVLGLRLWTLLEVTLSLAGQTFHLLFEFVIGQGQVFNMRGPHFEMVSQVMRPAHTPKSCSDVANQQGFMQVFTLTPNITYCPCFGRGMADSSPF